MKKIFAVANSHIDPVWLWDKFEGIDEVINTFRSACDRLDEYPELKFAASSITFYKWVEEYDYAVFERIKAHVASGRWEITGGWLVEADCNLPLSESFYKSAEISKKYVSNRFGVETPVAYVPDCFGHAASLPTILSDTGFKYYIFVRPEVHENPDLPDDLFYWEHNGNRVLCYRLKNHYTQGFDFRRERVESEIGADDFTRRGLACYFFGMGDHGGGPTKAEIDTLQAISTQRTDLDLKFSTCLEFFQAAEKLPNIPVYSGDLHYHAVGCYSVNRNLKHAIRGAERALCYTQRVVDASHTAADLDTLWETTIFNQFHDIMPGSCSPDAARQALDEIGGVRAASAEIAYSAIKHVSNGIPVACRQGEFRIFNSLPYNVTGPFEIESFLYFRPGAPFKDSSGREIAIQEVAPSVHCANHRWLFTDTIPAGTMNRYYFDSDDAPGFRQEGQPVYTDGNEIATARFEIASPGSIRETSPGTGLLKSPLTLGIIRDSSDTWSHGIRGYGKAEEYFSEVASTVHRGPIASHLLSRCEFGKSSAELMFTSYEDMPYVDLEIKVRWVEERSILKLLIEPDCSLQSLLVQGPGAAIEKRTDGAEEPLHGWMLAGELGILQDGAFAFDRDGGIIRITLIRSNLYGFHDPWIVDDRGPKQHTDIGEHRFRLRFIRREGLVTADMDRMFAEFVEPFHVTRSNS